MKLLLVLAACISCSNFTFAQEYALENYQANSIYLQNHLFGCRYVQEGKVYRKGFIMAARLEKELEVSPNAIVEFKRYRTTKLIALGLGVVGFGLQMYSVYNESGFNDGLYSISLAGLITSGFMSLNAKNKLQKSIWLYNQDILR
ncbi:MAG: hypothetical protein AAGG68_21850 [Bacteroidota bacterium]